MVTKTKPKAKPKKKAMCSASQPALKIHNEHEQAEHELRVEALSYDCSAAKQALKHEVELNRPSYLHCASISTYWCEVKHKIRYRAEQGGIIALGDTPADAMVEFDRIWYEGE